METEIKINGQESEKVSDIFKDSKHNHVSIFVHDCPDPDAMACAVSFNYIAKKFKKTSTIYYGGDISHAQNKALINVFSFDMVHIEDLDNKQVEVHKESIRNSIVVLLDTSTFGFGNCQSVKTLFKGEEHPEPDLIVDHHLYEYKGSAEYINKSVGSCSTICYKLLTNLRIKLDERIKTILFLGLMKDTDDFRQESSLTSVDRDVYKTLKEKIDLESYLRVVNCMKPRALINLKGLAYNQYNRQTGNCVVCGVGYIKPSQRSLLAEICDDLMQYDEIERCVCMGLIDEGIGDKKYLVASFRNSGDTINTHEFIRSIFGKEGAGGRKGSGGARIELGEITRNTIDGLNGNDDQLNSFFESIYLAYSDKILNEIKNQ